MKRTVAIIAAIIGITAAAQAADIVIELGSVTVPDAAVEDVQAWLETQVLYQTETTIETRTNPDTGESVDVEIQTQVLVVETPKDKLVRLMRAAAKAEVRDAVQALRQARADAAAQAAAQAEMDALADPVAE